MAGKKKEFNLPEDIAMLDELIRRYFKQLLKSVDENVKMGDFIKMIELRRKMTPANSEQRKFWKMLDRVRKETLRDTPSSGNDNIVLKSKGVHPSKKKNKEGVSLKEKV